MRPTFIAALLLSLFSSLYAQEGYEHFSAPAHGAGRTYVVTSRGLDAIGLNPALLQLPAGQRFEIRGFPITSFGIDAGESFSDADALADVFNIKSFDSLNKNKVVDLLRDEKLSGRGDAEVLGIAYDVGTLGSIAFSWTAHAAMRTDIPESFLEFFAHAESRIIQDTGRVLGLDLQALWHNEYTLTYARTLFETFDSNAFLRQFRAGASLKYVAGIGILKLEDGNYFIWNHENGGGNTVITANYRVNSAHTSDFDPKNAPNRFSTGFLSAPEAGSGIGADIGFSAELFAVSGSRSALHLGVSICGIGSITWKTNARERVVDNLKHKFIHESRFDELVDSLRLFEGTLVRVPEFSQSLPTTFRFGALLDLDALDAKMFGFAPQLAFELAQGLNDIVGAPPKPRFGLGMALTKDNPATDYRLSGGFAIDHRSVDITLGGGITLFDHVALDIATAHLLELFSSKPRVDVAVSLKVLL